MVKLNYEKEEMSKILNVLWFYCLWLQCNIWATKNSILYKIKKKKKLEKLFGTGANVLGGWEETGQEHTLICFQHG